MANTFEKQLEAIVSEYASAMGRSEGGSGRDVISFAHVNDLQTRCLAAIVRAAGRESVYYERTSVISGMQTNEWAKLAGHIGVARSLLSDIRNDFLKSLEEILHGDVFGDFLEMADHLTSNGYKDAAAVLAGSTLEAHLRQLSAKHGVATASGAKPKKADTLNADLTKAGAYSKADQKNVTAWLALRNNAAHGKYSEYNKSQVALLVSSVRDFITRCPA